MNALTRPNKFLGLMEAGNVLERESRKIITRFSDVRARVETRRLHPHTALHPLFSCFRRGANTRKWELKQLVYKRLVLIARTHVINHECMII